MPNVLMLGLYAMIATVLMGMGVVVAVSMNMGTAHWILIAAAAGAVLALPISWAVTRQMVKGRTAQ